MSSSPDDKAAQRALRLGLFYGVLGAMLFAGKGILIKLAYQHGVDTESFLGLRMLWSAPFFVWVAWYSDRALWGRLWRRRSGSTDASPASASPVDGDRHGKDRTFCRDGETAENDSAFGDRERVDMEASEGGDRVHSTLDRGASDQAANTHAEMPNQASTSVWRPGDVWRVFGLGFSGYYLASYLDFLGLQYVSVGLERVLLYLGPTFVLLISVFWLKRSVSPMQWAALAVSYVGVILVYLHDIDVGYNEHVLLGSLLVLGSCLSYAFYLLGAGEIVGRLGSRRLTAWASLVASILCVLQAIAMGGLTMFRQSIEVQGIAILTAIFSTVLPLFLTMAAVERLGAGKAAQVGMIGPVWTIFLGATILGEPVGPLQLVGTAVVILGVLMLSRVAKK